MRWERAHLLGRPPKNCSACPYTASTPNPHPRPYLLPPWEEDVRAASAPGKGEMGLERGEAELRDPPPRLRAREEKAGGGGTQGHRQAGGGMEMETHSVRNQQQDARLPTRGMCTDWSHMTPGWVEAPHSG